MSCVYKRRIGNGFLEVRDMQTTEFGARGFVVVDDNEQYGGNPVVLEFYYRKDGDRLGMAYPTEEEALRAAGLLGAVSVE